MGAEEADDGKADAAAEGESAEESFLRILHGASHQ
jgi:hypothetical protein